MRVRTEHWTLLLAICEEKPELTTNKFNGPEGKSKGHILWLNVAHQLNSLGFGEKSKEDWRKAFVDWRTKTKAKASKIGQNMEKTGGGSANCVPLSDLEKRLLHLMGKKAVEGDNVPEMGFGQVAINHPINNPINQDDNYESTNQRPSTHHVHQEYGSSTINRKGRVVRHSKNKRNSNRPLEISESANTYYYQ